MLTRMLRMGAVAGAFALALGMTIPTAAAQPFIAEEPTVTVSLADLDISQPQDRARAEHRLRRAAREVCGRYDGWDRWGPCVMREVRACERAATESAMAQAGLGTAYADLQWDENRRYQPVQLATDGQSAPQG